MTKELTIITPAELQNAGELLSISNEWLSKYKDRQSKLLEKAAKLGEKLTPELDEEMTKWQVSAKACVKKIKEDRMVYTSQFDAFKAKFTSIENELEKDLYAQIQAKRDISAAIYAREDREAREAAALKLKKEQEYIVLKAEAERQVKEKCAAILKEDKGDIFDAFNAADADTIDALEAELQGLEPGFSIKRWDEDIAPVLSSSLLSEKELNNIILNAKLGKFDLYSPYYKEEMANYAKYILSLFPIRRKEIAEGAESQAAAELKAKQEAVEEANRKEAERIAKEKEEEALNQAKIASELEEAKRKSEMTAAPIESYSISIEGKEGWMAIIAFYFQNMPVEIEKLGNVKLDSMRIFAEREAKKTGEMVLHEQVVYTEKYKAVARAQRKTGKETIAV